MAESDTKRGLTRITISMPQDLKDQLDKYGGGMNVSKVCREALSVALRDWMSRYGSDKASMSLSERLIAQLEPKRAGARADGHEAGAIWARGYGVLKTLTILKFPHAYGDGVDEVIDSSTAREDFEAGDRLSPLWTDFRAGFIRGAVETFDLAMKLVVGEELPAPQARKAVRRKGRQNT
jgi:hypothetical protein